MSTRSVFAAPSDSVATGPARHLAAGNGNTLLAHGLLAPWDTADEVFDSIDGVVSYWSDLFLSTAKDFIP